MPLPQTVALASDKHGRASRDAVAMPSQGGASPLKH